MSSTRVVIGTDDRGRPISEWRDDVPADATPAYGFMQPAYVSKIERRQATADELAAARAREDEPLLDRAPVIVKPSLREGAEARAQQSRMNGAARHVEVMAARRATTQEEPPMSELQPDDERLPAALAALADAARTASEAYDRKLAADEAWGIARLALTAAWDETSAIVAPPAPEARVVAPVVVAEPTPPQRLTSHESSPSARAGAKTARAIRVMAAMDRLGGDQRAVAVELGMRPNAVAIVVKHAMRRTVQA